MRARFTILIAATAVVALAACDGGPRLAATSAPVTVEGETNAAFQPITDVPIPDGARLDSERSLVLGGQDNWTGRLVFTIGESSADAFARYHQEMPRFGWRLITSVQAESSVLAFSQGDRVATILIEGRTLSGATVAITMSPRHSGDDSVQVRPLGE
ncbi:MAG: hypothetical protein O3B21_04855 [Proteobacteria bacterium]|nr:hypothetical protein [Pseudomonadota bacterium]MDA1355334.1 hypothetical protein [Pseudomonadota bacterium]